LRVRRAAGVLEIDYDDGLSQTLPVALLRAMTPSAAERGHGGGADEPLGRAFDGVRLMTAEPVGHYAVRLVFDDGHDSGLYTFAALRRFGDQIEDLQARHRLAIASAT